MELLRNHSTLRDHVLELARSLLPAISERAVRTDQERRVPDETIRTIKDTGLLNILVPRSLGGLEADFSDFSAVTREFASACGSTGWVYAILAETAWITLQFPKEGQDEVWSEGPVTCSSIVPFGRATRDNGGYRISGRWGYLSGSDHASWVVLSAKADGVRGGVLDVLVRKSDLRILDDWKVLGLAGSGSNSCVVEDLFVPAHRTVSHVELMEGLAPGRKVHPDHLLGRVPRGIVTAFSLTPVIVGLANHALRIAGEMLRHPGAALAPDWVVVQSKFSEATIDVDIANSIMTDFGEKTDKIIRSGRSITELDIMHTRLSASYMAKLSRRAVETLAEISGSRWLYDDHPFQLVYRDAQAAATHRSYNWDMASLAYCSALGLGSPQLGGNTPSSGRS